jgi:hypothetical protein
MRGVITRVRDVIKQNENAHVSFGVFESINSLAEADVKEYRMLDCLKIQKTGFQPIFEEHSSSSDGGAK